MEARLKFKPETLAQKGTIGKMLIWLQDNEPRCRNTNNAVIAKSMELSGIGVNFYNAKAMLKRMIDNQMLQRYGGKKRSTYIINYYHKDIPGYILDRAPAEVRERIERMKAELKENQHISDEGCVVTEPEKKEPEPTEDQPTQPELEDEKPVDASKASTNEESPKFSSDAPEENTTTVPIQIKDDERGISISITLNLNINK